MCVSIFPVLKHSTNTNYHYISIPQPPFKAVTHNHNMTVRIAALPDHNSDCKPQINKVKLNQLMHKNYYGSKVYL
jgi:hypothetical protein